MEAACKLVPFKNLYRLNSQIQDLGYRFDILKATVSKMANIAGWTFNYKD